MIFYTLKESNLFQLLVTLAAGCCSYIVCFLLIWLISKRIQFFQLNKKLIEQSLLFFLLIIGLIIMGIFQMCFIFDLGETYNYSKWYKRSFGPFGDGFPFAILLLSSFGFFLKSNALIVVAFAVIMLSGGRMIIAVSLLQMLLFYIYSSVRPSRGVMLSFILVPVFIYILTLIISNQITESFKEKVSRYVNSELYFISNNLAGRGACQTFEKGIKTQLLNPLNQRFITFVGGLWMTIKGGYPGNLYPNTSEKFADFMIAENPFAINDFLGLNWADWYRCGQVQNAYLNVGSGYGPLGLSLTIFFYFYTSFVGCRQLKNHLDQTPFRSLTVFFIFLSFFNQTQPWIQSGSLMLFLSGVAAAHIFRIEYSSRIRCNHKYKSYTNADAIY